MQNVFRLTFWQSLGVGLAAATANLLFAYYMGWDGINYLYIRSISMGIWCAIMFTVAYVLKWKYTGHKRYF